MCIRDSCRICRLVYPAVYAGCGKTAVVDNTIFVFLGDHGKMVGTPECEMPQSYNHIPLMIYGKDIKPGVYEDVYKRQGMPQLSSTAGKSLYLG